MSDGWACDNCETFHPDVHLVTKIVVSIHPRQYAAEVTLCSLRCFDEYRSELDDSAAWAEEHNESMPRFRQFVIEEPA